MATSITGGCDECGSLITTGVTGKALDPSERPDPMVGIVCNGCWDGKYSKSAIREKRLNKFLEEPKKKWWKFGTK
ncbi:MAG: hypothetical protein SLAVMIC_00161 [uncultured marine phage]|uniref:Uncharacterized protein n=1 Tax=uncultured marine phage TaxID=707152 RepID=A0A8D9FQI5_9VIRU|nr:MAG: hypothetical protein SLAVMIC_00161 [uncultured marine phage]